MKYIMFQAGDLKYKLPVIFPDTLVHEDVAEALLPLLPGGAKVISAGECTVMGQCSGRSETLKVASRGDKDSAVVNTFNYTHGLVP